ncbi:hypothetical protein EK21DRAFT_92309 [Setomelanomma holmii]|uniref:Uncharacterized protein n=1 Tax=Setomelanomma holmii TaxID=210430 RepID=A0A9P4LIU9_9PLEO|nr:hypothetical protein EK21DRAFT_92309 [Setomelanomma holmii]
MAYERPPRLLLPFIFPPLMATQPTTAPAGRSNISLSVVTSIETNSEHLTSLLEVDTVSMAVNTMNALVSSLATEPQEPRQNRPGSTEVSVPWPMFDFQTNGGAVHFTYNAPAGSSSSQLMSNQPMKFETGGGTVHFTCNAGKDQARRRSE